MSKERIAIPLRKQMIRRLALLVLMAALPAGAVSHLAVRWGGLVAAFSFSGQAGGNSPDGVWQSLSGNASQGSRRLRLNAATLQRVLDRAPLEAAGAAAASQAVVALPLPDGSFARFRLVESPILEPGLAAKFPNIKSYRGQGVDDPRASVRFGWSPRGLHGLILTGGGVSLYPPNADDPATYVSEYGEEKAWQCGFDESRATNAGRGPIKERNIAVGGALRVYRIAIATTQEYTNHPQLGGGTVAGAVASLNAWLNIANAVYERDLSVRLVLVNNTQIIRTAEPDGFTNGDTSVLLSEVPAILGMTVGEANYDLGHIFSTSGGGGVASLGVVCSNNPLQGGPAKGSGSSSADAPTGNAGSAKVILHEIGHQFGANHSFNGSVGQNCGGAQRSLTTSWESGSGTTLMSYQGLCTDGTNTDNIADPDNSRFHIGSITQMLNYLAGAPQCATMQPTGNNPPNVNGGADYTIPRNTPFTLMAAGSDPDLGDNINLTYNWEQLDVGGAAFAQNGTAASYSDAGDPPTTTRPIFRPFPSTPNPARTFPALIHILNSANVPPGLVNGFWTAESLPSVTRALNFRVTARDNRAGGGGLSDDQVTINVHGTAGPFQITAPNTAVNWTGGSAQTVTWDVNNTNAAPINCANVRISLSTDGGQSFPITLAASTPNDGSETINVPGNLTTGAARIKVEAVGNVFFDISNANFNISVGAGCPVPLGLSPAGATPGTTVAINGSGFTGVTTVRFSGNQNAVFNVVSDNVINATVPAGALTGPITLIKATCQDVATALFFVCGNSLNATIDDGTPETTAGGFGNDFFVNRLTPASYPATLTAVQLRFDESQNVAPGTAVNLLAAAHPSGATNIDNTVFQTTPVVTGALGDFTTYNLSAPITITSGDFVVGFGINTMNMQAPQLLDTTAFQNRSYSSFNGTTFQPLNNSNLMIRAQYLTNCGVNTTCPTGGNFTPGNGAPGVAVTITGANLTGVTAVRFANNVNAAFTVNSDTQITATVPAGAVTGAIRLLKPNCNDLVTANFTVNAVACLTVNGFTPAAQQIGGALTITGAGFSGVNVVKFAGEHSAAFTVDSDTQLTVIVPPNAQPGPIIISKAGCANAQTAAFSPCNATLSLRTDDGELNARQGGAGRTTLVQRLTPAGYPATLDSVQVLFDAEQMMPVGTAISILAGSNPGGGTAIGNVVFQTLNTTVGSLGQFNNFTLSAPITITAGDFVIGYAVDVQQGMQPGLLDTTAPAGRAYSAVAGGALTPDPENNYFIRGQYTRPCGAPQACATVTGLMPNAAQIGAAVTLTGTNFTGVTGVRFSNGLTATFNVVNDTTITTTVPGGAVTGAITLLKAGCGDAAWGPFTVNPPALAIGDTTATEGNGGNRPNRPAVNEPFTVTLTGVLGLTTPVTVSFATADGTATAPADYATTGGTLTFNPPFTQNTVTQTIEVPIVSDDRVEPNENFFVNLSNSVNATVSDAQGQATIINDDQCPTITVNPATLDNGFVGTAYSRMLTATGGLTPYGFTVSGGSLPGGLSLATNGALTGTPTTAGTFNFIVEATDDQGCTGMRSYTVLIGGSGLMFYPLPQPVRLLETRSGFNGCNTPGAPIATNSTFTLPARTNCAGIPANAAAVTGNVTVVPSAPGYLTLFPGDAVQPTVANSNFRLGEITNNVFTVGLGAANGDFKIFSSANTEVIVDVTGYYAPPGNGGLYFHPLPAPLRLLETRSGFNGCFTPGLPLDGTGNPNSDPSFDLAVQGRMPLPCVAPIPANAQVLVGNATSVFPNGGGYLTIYPSGGNRPLIASSNYAGTDVINGPFAVKLGADGKFKIYTLVTTHLVVDILGYYSEDAVDINGAGLLFNPLPEPVRLLETRPGGPPLTGCTRTNAPIAGNLNMATHTQQARNFCGLPASTQAVVGNVSVVNSAGAGFLTLFPGNLPTAPLVATSNYPAPATFGYNRHFFVGLSPAEGTFKVLTQATTDLVVDVSGYFAP